MASLITNIVSTAELQDISASLDTCHMDTRAHLEAKAGQVTNDNAHMSLPDVCPPARGEAEAQHILPTDFPPLSRLATGKEGVVVEGGRGSPEEVVHATSTSPKPVSPCSGVKKQKKTPGPQERNGSKKPRSPNTQDTGKKSTTNSQNASRRVDQKGNKGDKNVLNTPSVTSETTLATGSVITTQTVPEEQTIIIIAPRDNVNIEDVHLGFSDYLFNLPIGPTYVTGRELMDVLKSNAVFERGSKYRFDNQGEYDCESHGVGWCIVNSNPSKNINHVYMQPATTVISVEGYRYRDGREVAITIEPRSYLVYQPVFSKYVKQFRGVQMTESLLNAIVANSVDGTANYRVLQETQQYYLALMTKRYYAQVNNKEAQVVIQNNGNALWKGSDGYTDFRDLSSELVDHYMPWQIPDEECSLPLDWACRDDFEILKCRNVEFSAGVVNGNNEPDDRVRVDFHTYRENPRDNPYMHFNTRKTKPRHRTAYFKLGGINMPDFSEYSNSANNLTHGLKRLFGAKKDEKAQREEAAKLGAHIAMEINTGLFGSKQIGKRMFNELTARRRYEKPVKDYITAVFNGERLESVDFQVREFIAKGYAQIYKECTRTKIDRFVDALNTSGHWAYYQIYKQMLTHFACLFSRQQLAEIAHVKRMLRKRYVEGSLLSDQDDLLVRRLNVNIKRELAKYGKAPRCFVSYDEGCVYANELPEFCKVGIDGKHIFTHGKYTLLLNIMAKPKPTSLNEIFDDLDKAMSTDDYMYAAIYSDDMVIAGRMAGKSFCFNLDISSNDSSQDLPGFLAAYGCMSNFHEIRGANLIRQCMLPLTIVSPEDVESFLVAQFAGPFEGSGSVLTTLLNHLGSTLIVLSFFRLLCGEAGYQILTDEVIEACAVKGARMVGHAVTIDSCHDEGVFNFYHVQFLKRSPFHNGKEWRPYTNLGCILRALGTVEDDLCENQFSIPSSKFWALSNEQRISLFCNGVVKGWKHEPTNPIMKALRERFSDDHPSVRSTRELIGTPNMGDVKHDSLIHIFTEVEDLSAEDNTVAIMARYGCSMEEINQLARQISRLQVGHEVRSHCYTKIMCVDYGVQV